MSREPIKVYKLLSKLALWFNKILFKILVEICFKIMTNYESKRLKIKKQKINLKNWYGQI